MWPGGPQGRDDAGWAWWRIAAERPCLLEVGFKVGAVKGCLSCDAPLKSPVNRPAARLNPIGVLAEIDEGDARRSVGSPPLKLYNVGVFSRRVAHATRASE